MRDKGLARVAERLLREPVLVLDEFCEMISQNSMEPERALLRTVDAA